MLYQLSYASSSGETAALSSTVCSLGSLTDVRDNSKSYHNGTLRATERGRNGGPPDPSLEVVIPKRGFIRVRNLLLRRHKQIPHRYGRFGMTNLPNYFPTH